jgi:hypothetical protein
MMSMLDDDSLPDMRALHKTNDLIPDPSKLEVTQIPAEDIAGWFVPFEVVFGIVYWDTWGLYLVLAFVATMLFGWIIPMQQRYAMLAKSEFMKEKTMLAHLTWDEQCEVIQFEPILEPAYKYDEEGKVILDADDEPVPDELDIEDWVTMLDLEAKIIDHEDGMLSAVHTLDSRYIANLFQQMYEARTKEVMEPSFSYDKMRWFTHTIGRGLRAIGRGLKWSGGKARGGAGAIRTNAPSPGGGLKRLGGWFSTYKLRFGAAIVIGFMVILFSNWIWWGLRLLLQLFGWMI